MTAAIAGVMSEILVGSITEASENLGLSPFFVGIVVAVVGNAAEHWVAIYFALRDNMDLAVNIAIGSSAKIALFVAPVLVLLSFLVGPFPMALVFNGFEVGAIFLRSRSPTRSPRRRVDLVRGPPAAGRVRRARADLLLRDLRLRRPPGGRLRLQLPVRGAEAVAEQVPEGAVLAGQQPEPEQDVDPR